MRTEQRKNKLERVIGFRQRNVTLVLENVHDQHNVSAIFRTCDSVGIDEVCLIYNSEVFPKIDRKCSASASKWVQKRRFFSVDDCYTALKNEGFMIIATELSTKSKSLWDIDFTNKIAIVFGNEHRGVSEEASKKADLSMIIPMFGMVQSMNVSVSCGVVLFELARQRFLKGLYNNKFYSKEEFNKKLDDWLIK